MSALNIADDIYICPYQCSVAPGWYEFQTEIISCTLYKIKRFALQNMCTWHNRQSLCDKHTQFLLRRLSTWLTYKEVQVESNSDGAHYPILNLYAAPLPLLKWISFLSTVKQDYSPWYEYNILGHLEMKINMSLPWWWRQDVSPKCTHHAQQLHGVTTQMATSSILNYMKISILI